MKIVIDIPDAFVEYFNNDRFEDSLHRLSADANLLAGNYEQETAIMLIEAFKNAQVVNNTCEDYHGIDCYGCDKRGYRYTWRKE